MEEIRVYQVPFSHFCDKVRWSLDFYSLKYKTINYIGRQTPGLEKAPRTLQKLTPIIEDQNNGSLFISDSTPILLYLDNHYGNKKTLFPRNMNDEKDVIIQYCLKLDSELGLYARRLAYLHVISEKPAILSVFIDNNFDQVSRDDWKSYFLGLLGSCVVIGRFGLHRINEENIYEKTICLLEEIKTKIDGKHYLFNDQFTAADLTLTSLIQPLTFVTPLFIKYKSIFEYSDEIRQRHDPRKWQDSIPERLFKQQRQSPQRKSKIRNTIWYIFYILFYPLHFLFNHDSEKIQMQYPSNNPGEKANNDVRILKFNSIINTPIFFIKYFWHLCFTIPKQMEFVKNQGNKILHK
jgi:glutathione S-transferase